MIEHVYIILRLCLMTAAFSYLLYLFLKHNKEHNNDD